MSDLASAIKMEEKELQRMKVENLRRLSDTGRMTSLPSSSIPSTKTSPQGASRFAETGPDLMTFQDISNRRSSDQLSSQQPNSERSTTSVYDKNISNVLSLFNTKQTTQFSGTSVQQQQQTRYQPAGQVNYSWPSHSGFNRNVTLPRSNAPVLPQYYQPISRLSSLPPQLSSGMRPYRQISAQTMAMQKSPQHVGTFPNSMSNVQLQNTAIAYHSRLAPADRIENFESNFVEAHQFPRPSSLGKLDGSNFDLTLSTHVKNPSESAQSSLFATQDKGICRSSSVGSNLQTGGDQLQNEKLTNIFDEWLNDGWKSNSVTASPLHESSKVNKKTPDWLEWDPLNKQSEELLSIETLDASTKGTAFLIPKAESLLSNVKETAVTKESEALSSQQFHQNEKNQMDVFVEIDNSTEIQHFAVMLEQLRSSFIEADHISNPGHVISLMIDCNRNPYDRAGSSEDDDGAIDGTVRISVTTDGILEPVTFECDVKASVEHVVSQALCIAYEDISCVSTNDFFFKVVGRQEYLISKSRLGLYQYVRECRKFDQDIRLELLHKSKVDHSLRRSAEDDAKKAVGKDFLEVLGKPADIKSRDQIQILVEAFYKESQALLDGVKLEHDSTSATVQQQFERVLQTVKTMCAALGGLESNEVADDIKMLRSSLVRPPTSPGCTNTSISTSLISLTEDDDHYSKPLSMKFNKIREGLENLTSSMLDFTQMYCKAFEVDAYFRTVTDRSNTTRIPRIVSTIIKDLYSVNVVSVQRLPKQWETTHDEFYVTCSLWHGDRQLSVNNPSTKPSKIVKTFYSKVVWNNWLEFDVSVGELPLEVTLRTILYGTTTNDEKVTTKKLAWLNIPLFDHNKIMRHQNELYGMWDFPTFASKLDKLHGPLTCSHDIRNRDSSVLQLSFSEDRRPSMVVENPQSSIADSCRPVQWKGFATLDEATRTELESALARARLIAGPLFNLTQHEKELLWENRCVVGASNEHNGPAISLPVLLQCVLRWGPSFGHLQDAYEILASWPKRLEPEESLALLTNAFPDTQVRAAAIRWLEMAGDMEISSWLPQLVQAVRCEQRINNPLAKLLLRRAMGSVKICHQLYWLLHENMWDKMYEARYCAMHAALLTICGNAMKREFEKELYFLKMIHRVAEGVKETKDSMKSTLLTDDLTKKVAKKVGGKRFRISTNPALVTSGINVKNSSYFTSNAVPLKLAFINADIPDSDIYIMYKVGDDLRQDALTMQLIRVMDRMWLSEGLDLRIVTFDCLPTGPNRGMVEIVSDSKTFREIQSSYGLTGAFKDRPIAEWLQKYNPTGISYEKAVENFTLSCAGYCVATYVLGICDRHNDNIMLRRSGHLFHIDFARFLGHAQMFGNIKRDRAPFVLTSDMAYVINGGDRPSSKFQDFVDLCCRAFNILRKHSHTIINLLSLMLNCGIPELSSKSDLKYVYDTLKPNASDTEATTMFTRLIDASLSSSFTRLNFFIHNLAQMRFHGNESEEDRKILSFSPQIHGYKEEEGVIVSASVVGYQKRYSPEKYYIYCIKVNREKNSASIDSYVLRTFSEFEELHRKLSYNSTLQPPSFPNSVVVGRSQVKQVADRRRAKLNTYLSHLLKSQRPVAMHDLVYTFFHPILRDEEQQVNSNAKSPDLTVGGEIKISLHHKNNAFYIMVHHCKNLSPVNGSDPDPYVKTYLLPDPSHSTKRKTKVARKTLHPTYNEMLVYNLSVEEVRTKQLYVGVWNYESLQENDFMGSAVIDLSSVDVTVETSKWYSLKSSSL